MHKPYKTRMRMPSVLDPHADDIACWLAAEPRITALAILARLVEQCPGQFGTPQHTTVQRLLKTLRRKAAGPVMAGAEPAAPTNSTIAAHVSIDAGSKRRPAQSAAPIAKPPAIADACFGNIIS